MPKSRREQMREELEDCIEESEQRKDDSGKFGDYFKKDIEDLVKWKCEKGGHIIDIIPYITGKNDPHRPEGKTQYVLDLWIHQNVGVTEDRVVCLSRNYKEACPICEHQAQLRAEDDFDEDLVDSLNPKRRAVYNIICYDSTEEEDKGVQVWEVAYFFMEKKLLPLLKDKRTGERIKFIDPDKGKSISFDVVDKTYKDKKDKKDKDAKPRKGIDFEGHKLEDRDYIISDDDLDAAYCLDDIIEILDYDTIYKMYWQEEPDGDGQEEKSVEEETTSRRNRSGRKSSRSQSGNNCHHGGSFGEDLNKLDECNTCDDYDDCFARHKELDDGGNGDGNAEPVKEEQSSRRGRGRSTSGKGSKSDDESSTKGTSTRRSSRRKSSRRR